MISKALIMLLTIVAYTCLQDLAQMGMWLQIAGLMLASGGLVATFLLSGPFGPGK